MAIHKVYQFQTYDIHSDTIRVSKRWGTLEGIEVDARFVGGEIEGLSDIGFNPRVPPKPGVFK